MLCVLSTCVFVTCIWFSASTQIISPDSINQFFSFIDIWCFLCCINQFMYIILTNFVPQRVYLVIFRHYYFLRLHSFDDSWMNKRMRTKDLSIVTDRARPKFSEGILSQYRFVYHKSHMVRRHAEPGHLLSKINKKVLLSRLTAYAVWRHLL